MKKKIESEYISLLQEKERINKSLEEKRDELIKISGVDVSGSYKGDLLNITSVKKKDYTFENKQEKDWVMIQLEKNNPLAIKKDIDKKRVEELLSRGEIKNGLKTKLLTALKESISYRVNVNK